MCIQQWSSPSWTELGARVSPRLDFVHTNRYVEKLGRLVPSNLAGPVAVFLSLTVLLMSAQSSQSGPTHFVLR